MEKKLIIAILLLLCTGAVANAQFGITSRGKLKDGFHGSPSSFIYDDGILPKYLPKAKSVIVKYYSCDYDRYSEECVNCHCDSLKYVFDSNGVIREVYYYDQYGISKNQIQYNGNKIIQFGNTKFKYDQHGWLTNFFVNNYYGDNLEYEIHFKLLSSQLTGISGFKHGELVETHTYSTSNNLRSIEISSYVDHEHKHYFIERDEHDVRTHTKIFDDKNKIENEVFYENEYDENGNLIITRKYTMRDIGKYIERCFQYEYEYVF